ncbi:dermonecrotic toxin domain-containing protein [Pseudomonas sp. NPDC089752]|uniref:dermonecrotic toxin domain-containing protein n=1 Tax=Pseudomonas sp. NPDC089752 TaxID=3364472 RepID=UPI003827B1AB
MTTAPPPFHQAQILDTLPGWVSTMHPDHIGRIVQAVRKDYLDENGSPYSWYGTASQDDQALLQQLMTDRDTRIKALHGALKDFKSIREFCKPLLAARLGLSVEVDQAQYIHQPSKTYKHQVNPPGLEISLGRDQPHDPALSMGADQPYLAIPDGPAQKRSLLEAALHNFEGPEEVGTLDQLTLGLNDGRSIPLLEPRAFVEQCRALDLGQRYQDHLHAVYEGSNRAEVQRLWTEATQQALAVESMAAYLKGLLTLEGRAALAQLCNNERAPAYGDRPLHCWRISLFDIALHDVLLIGPDEDDQANPCILYIPQDTEHPIREYASLQKVGDFLRQHLLHTPFRRQLISFADKNRQAELASMLDDAVFEVNDSLRKPRKTPKNLHFSKTGLSLPIWPALYTDHTRRLMADARTIAVPTADADAKARMERLKSWLEQGLTLLNVAAFFVPGADVVMMGVFAYDIMDSVFTGFDAWEAGDTHEALLQLESLAINAAAIGGFAGTAKLVKASGFVDGLESVWKGGKPRLWNPDMAPYASTRPLPVRALPDEQGLYTVGEKQFLSLDDHLYEVSQSAEGQWLAHQPGVPDAYTPDLRYLGDKRWQWVHDDPLTWDDARLVRGLGQFSEALEASEQLTALRIAGVDAKALRNLQITGKRPPALLTDMLLRLHVDNETQHIITRVRHGLALDAYKNFALPELTNMPGWPLRYRLKVFTGAEKWGDASYFGPAETPDSLEIEISRADLNEGNLSKIVAAAMDEDSLSQLLPESAPERRWRDLNELLANRLTERRQRIFESMLKGHQATPSIAIQTLGRQFPGLPENALEEIVAQAHSYERQRMTSGRVPLRVAEEARYLQARARVDRALLGLYRPNLANDDSQLLREALLAKHTQASETELLDLALEDRRGCATALGQQPIKPGFRSPLRLAHGRIGYPLSGRLQWLDTASRKLNRLYPGLTKEQTSALHAQLHQRGDIGAQITALERERETLDRALARWVAQGSDAQQPDRQRLRDGLNSSWRRDDGATLTLQGLAIETLPSLPARFDHITTLQVRNLGIRQIPDDFFQSFPSLRTLRLVQTPQLDFDQLAQALQHTPRLQGLELGSNQLGELSEAMRLRIGNLHELRRLSLRNNGLQLSDTDLQTLAQLPLERLDLENNLITLTAEMASRFSSLRRVTDLRLSHNPLQHAPDVTGQIGLVRLELRNCQLTHWPQGLTELMNVRNTQLRFIGLSDNNIAQTPDLDRVLNSEFATALQARQRFMSWDLTFNPIDAQAAQRFRAVGAEIEVIAPPLEAVDWLSDASEAQRQLWADLFAEGDYPMLRDSVERVGFSAQARKNPQGMARQVWQLLESAAQDEHLRDRLNSVADEFPASCGDSATDGFSTLEVEALAHATVSEESSRPSVVFNFYRRLYRREMVNVLSERLQLARFARREGLFAWERLPTEARPPAPDMPALDELDDIGDEDLLQGGVDLIEIRLALRQELAQRLNFPEPSSDMLYRDTAMITYTTTYKVEDAVNALDHSAVARRRWIARAPGWKSYLKSLYADQFDEILLRWNEGLEYLHYCLDANADAVTELDPRVLKVLQGIFTESPLGSDGQLRRVNINSGLYESAANGIKMGRELEEEALLYQRTAMHDPNM